MLILQGFRIGIALAKWSAMHVRIDRLYQFVMGTANLTEREQAHLARCRFCVIWLDACADEKISLLTRRYRDARLS
jgi:hypothetical protein